MSEVILEVIAGSVADAIEAQQGGASRLEVVRDLDRGGLTPSLELVRAIKETVDLPLRVMVRESDGYEPNRTEIDRLCEAAAEFSQLDVDGLVIGFLKEGTLDVDLMAQVLACAPHSKATLHHAFEDAVDRLAALREVKRLSQVDRILSHGGTDEWEQRSQRLDSYAQAAAPHITIVAGGGIDSDAIAMLRRSTAICEFHVGRAAREGFQNSGPVRADLVRALARATQDK